MDEAITSQFGADRFATAQMARLDVGTGLLEWVTPGIQHRCSCATIASEPAQETVRLLSRALMLERGGVTSDDATLLLLEWRGGSVNHLGTGDNGASSAG